jgi:hypothetical protein
MLESLPMRAATASCRPTGTGLFRSHWQPCLWLSWRMLTGTYLTPNLTLHPRIFVSWTEFVMRGLSFLWKYCMLLSQIHRYWHSQFRLNSVRIQITIGLSISISSPTLCTYSPKRESRLVEWFAIISLLRLGACGVSCAPDRRNT